MQKSEYSKFEVQRSKLNVRNTGFTLIEVILVLVLLLVIVSISLPHFAGTFRGTKLRTASRTVSRMARYARSMAIMREETMTVALNHETMEIFLGGSKSVSTNAADGVLDQAALKNLGYIDGEAAADDPQIEKEVRRFLPDGLTVRDFEKEWTDDDHQYHNFYLIRYFPNGQCEKFEMELEDHKGLGVKLANDPITGKISSEFIQ